MVLKQLLSRQEPNELPSDFAKRLLNDYCRELMEKLPTQRVSETPQTVIQVIASHFKIMVRPHNLKGSYPYWDFCLGNSSFRIEIFKGLHLTVMYRKRKFHIPIDNMPASSIISLIQNANKDFQNWDDTLSVILKDEKEESWHIEVQKREKLNQLTTSIIRSSITSFMTGIPNDYHISDYDTKMELVILLKGDKRLEFEVKKEDYIGTIKYLRDNIRSIITLLESIPLKMTVMTNKKD